MSNSGKFAKGLKEISLAYNYEIDGKQKKNLTFSL